MMQSATQQSPLENVAMASPSHLKQWLQATGKSFLVINALDMVDSLAWPDGVETLMQVIAAYGEHRRGTPSGTSRPGPDGNPIPDMKSEALDLEELRRCIGKLIGDARALDPSFEVPRDC